VAITIVLSHILFFLLIVPLPPTFTLFPYTTLFRSGRHSVDRSGPTRCGCVDRAHDGVRELARRWRHWYPSRDDGRRPRACRAARSEERRVGKECRPRGAPLPDRKVRHAGLGVGPVG